MSDTYPDLPEAEQQMETAKRDAPSNLFRLNLGEKTYIKTLDQIREATVLAGYLPEEIVQNYIKPETTPVKNIVNFFNMELNAADVATAEERYAIDAVQGKKKDITKWIAIGIVVFLVFVGGAYFIQASQQKPQTLDQDALAKAITTGINSGLKDKTTPTTPTGPVVVAG